MKFSSLFIFVSLTFYQSYSQDQKKNSFIQLKKELAKIEKELAIVKKERDSSFEVLNNYIKRESIEFKRGTITKSAKKKISKLKYKALIIAVQDYTFQRKLKYPIKDALKLRKLLINNYNFSEKNVDTIFNPTLQELKDKLRGKRKNINENDAFLIFFAGHGAKDPDYEELGYWLLKDSGLNINDNWLSNDLIRMSLKYIKSKHTLLISDACFSGSILSEKRNISPYNAFEKIISTNSRMGLTSGLNKVVPDRSVFFRFLLKNLSENQNKYLLAGDLYFKVRYAVIHNTNNQPQFAPINNVGHEGGEFVFIKKNEK